MSESGSTPGPASGSRGGSSPPRGAGGVTRERVFLGILALALAPAVFGLAGVWSTVDYLSHGFLVPVVSLWIWMRERPRRERQPIAPEPRGVAALGVSLLAVMAGLLSSLPWLQGIGIVGAVAGALWWLRGSAWLQAGAFPVGFLIFMVPPPTSWTTPLIVRLQMWVSIVAVDVLGALGEPVQREGNVMILPGGGALFVAEACSGVTSVITLAPLAVLLAYLGLETRWGRALLALSVVPLAMAGNLARVLSTAVLADRYGVEIAAEGPAHTMLGLSTYVVAVGLMIGLDAVLRKIERQRA